MHRWGPRLDWEHLQNWIPGVLGAFAAILLVVVAANSPTQTDTKPAEVVPSQSAALATNRQTDAPSPSRAALPQSSPATGTVAKAQTPAPSMSPAPATKTVDVPMSAPAHDPAMVKAETVVPSAPPQSTAKPDKEPQKAVANAAGLQGDAVAGRQVFKKCQACHSLEPGKTILGPSLAGIVGRKSGAEPDFTYSPAMKQAALTWDALTLDAYLAEPAKIVPGNRMPFPGLKTDQDRKDVIAFLAAPAAPPGAPAPAKAASPAAPAAAAPQANAAYLTDAKYTLRTGIAEGKWSFWALAAPSTARQTPY
jgi:nitrite reductase (NO-forming)